MLLPLCGNVKEIEYAATEVASFWNGFKERFSLDNGLLVKKFLGIEESGLKHTKADKVYSWPSNRDPVTWILGTWRELDDEMGPFIYCPVEKLECCLIAREWGVNILIIFYS